ncbi:MAG TPA: hypothetical protein PKD70_02970 [Saprospiraceae bacterium]|nr:hypothetical protein [Saprospiraceae bacterium]HMP12817.1 hypothetical protein [Saprospiraceae bacterium]
MRIFILLCYCGWATTVGAQMFNDLQAVEETLRRIANVRDANSRNRYANVQGSPLLQEEWSPGTLQLKDLDTTRMNLTLNIDLSSELLLVRLQDGSVGMISPFSVRWVEIEDLYRRRMRLFIVKTEHEVAHNQSFRPVFYEVLLKNEYTLLRRIYKRLYTPYPILYDTSDGHREIATIETFWLQKPDKSWHRLKCNPRALRQLLPEHQEDIRQLSKRQKFDLYRVEGIIQLLQQINKQ